MLSAYLVAWISYFNLANLSWSLHKHSAHSWYPAGRSSPAQLPIASHFLGLLGTCLLLDSFDTPQVLRAPLLHTIMDAQTSHTPSLVIYVVSALRDHKFWPHESLLFQPPNLHLPLMLAPRNPAKVTMLRWVHPVSAKTPAPHLTSWISQRLPHISKLLFFFFIPLLSAFLLVPQSWPSLTIIFNFVENRNIYPGETCTKTTFPAQIKTTLWKQTLPFVT